MTMKIRTTLGALSLGAILALSGCGSDGNSSNPGGNGDDSGNGGDTSKYRNVFLQKSFGDQVEELMGGIIGIVDEVANGKMGDPLGDTLAQADTTKVESQFSWNSTMDFYNNIVSVKKVCDGGLEEIAESGYDKDKIEEIEEAIEDALKLIAAISDANGDGKLETSDLIANNGAFAFRNQILDPNGRVKIQAAIDKLNEIKTKLETVKPALNLQESPELKAKVKNVVENVIIAGYTKLGQEADKLANALTTLKNQPTAANLQAARDQWRATREPWEAGEGHIFGPVDTLGIDPKVDSWPVNKVQLDGALGGWDPELSNIDGFPVTMKGFHAIEYLLFGDGTTLESAEDGIARLQTPVGDEDTAEDKIRLKYLEALGKSLQKDLKTLANAW